MESTVAQPKTKIIHVKTKKSWDTKIETIQFLIHLDLSNYYNFLLHIKIMKIPNPPIFSLLKEAVLKAVF